MLCFSLYGLTSDKGVADVLCCKTKVGIVITVAKVDDGETDVAIYT